MCNMYYAVMLTYVSLGTRGEAIKIMDGKLATDRVATYGSAGEKEVTNKDGDAVKDGTF